MIRVVTALLIVVVLIALAPRPEARAHSIARQYFTVNGGLGVNLREGPGGSYARIVTMPMGSRVYAYGHVGSWAKVKYLATGQIGWAWLAYLLPASAPSGGGGATGGGSTSGLQRCWDSSFGVVYCAPDWIAQQIYAAAVAWGVPYWAMMGIASCESGFDPGAYNPASGVSGIYQFQPSTMAWIYPGGNVWSVHDSAYAAAKLLAWGYSSAFDCAWRIGY